MKHFFLLKEYLKYKLRAKSAHGIHSPFVFNFITEVIANKGHYYAYETMQAFRDELLTNHNLLEVEDFGAGSLKNSSTKRKISDIARTAGRNHRFGSLLFKMVDYFKSKHILELGTSLGLGTGFMALANEHAEVTTVEGSSEIAKQAAAHFRLLDIQNIKQIVGNFDHALEPLLKQQPWDFIFVDGNHRKEATLRYFNLILPYRHTDMILVFDDIHWTKGMLEAWNIIHKHPQVTCSLDLFYFGIVFFNKEIREKQHFVLKYG